MTEEINLDPLGRYPEEELDNGDGDDYWGTAEDNGTMPENLNQFGRTVIGRKIVSAEKVPLTDELRAYVKKFGKSVFIGGYFGWGFSTWENKEVFKITLDDGSVSYLANTGDCCAYTELEGFWLHPESVNHVIMGVGTTEKYETWHVYADYGDILKLEVGWSCGNPFYYGYGFDVVVVAGPTE